MGNFGKMVLQRVGLGFLTLFVISLMVFFAVQMLPGDPATAILGQGASPEAIASLRRELGLDVPAMNRYAHWLFGLFHGDLGTSLSNHRAVAELIGTRLVNSAVLAVVAAVIAMPIGIGLGIFVTLFRQRMRGVDHVASLLSLAAISLPEFFVAYILVAVFSIGLGWFPAVAFVEAGQGFGDRLAGLVLPAIALSLTIIAYVMRMTRAAILNVLSAPYIEMAHLKGMREIAIVLRHALPNALSPVINVVIMNLANLVVGVVVIEVVFVYPGLGQLLVDAVAKRDLPVVQACCMIFATTYVSLNLLADLMAIWFNPRLRHPRQRAK